jgi:predicted Zn-dependent protease with MMP-like domain
MTRRQMISAAVVVVIVVALLATPAITGDTGFDSLVGLLGVIVGVAISELSRHRSGELDREHQLRMAALERRLQAHQEGYAL